MNPLRKNILPYAAIGLSILCLSTSALFIRWADAPGPVTGFYRMTIATLLLTPFALARQSRTRTLNRQNFYLPLIAGIFSGFDLGIWSISLNYTSAANATLLGNTAPLWVALAAMIFFHEKLSRQFWVGLILAMTGSALIIGTDFLIHPGISTGDLIALATGMFYAGFYIFTQFSRRTLDPVTHMWLVGVSASCALFVLNLMLGNSLTGYTPQTYMIFAATALVSQLTGYLASSYALGYLPASIVSVTMIGQPVTTAIIAIPLLDETPTPAQTIGGIVALAGIYIANLAHIKAQKEITE